MFDKFVKRKEVFFMKKQILSISLAAALAVLCTGIAMAEDKTPTVFVNQGQIFFDDQAPVILGEGTTLVPARGVFEAMGAKVEWKEETRTVDVTSSDNKTLIRLTIDDSTMKVFDVSGVFGALMSGQDFVAPENDVTLDVAPQIISDRTMIPLRAISEALDADVQWNGEDYTINITTANAPSADAGVPALSLSADKLTAAKDEEVVLSVNAENLPTEKFVSGVTATVKYDPTAFEFVKAELVNGDNVIEGTIGAANPEFTYGYVKAASVTVNAETAVKTDGAVMKLTFKSLTGEKGSFQLSNGYNTKLGYNTSLLVDSVDNVGDKSVQYEGDDLKVSQVEVVINGTDAPAETVAPTVEPTATVDPSATVEPTATVDPTATAAPEATVDPTATVEPTETPAETAAPTATPAA